MKRPCPLEKVHQTDSFDCDEEALNVYLKKYARQNQNRDASRTYVLLDNNRVTAFYTLVFGSVSWDRAPESIRQGLGKYPIPILIVARLAVDRTEQGKGLGSVLLQDALIRALRASEIAGLRAVVVDAKNVAAKQFYESQGFYSSPFDPMKLFLPISELKKAAG